MYRITGDSKTKNTKAKQYPLLQHLIYTYPTPLPLVNYRHNRIHDHLHNRPATYTMTAAATNPANATLPHTPNALYRSAAP